MSDRAALTGGVDSAPGQGGDQSGGRVPSRKVARVSRQSANAAAPPKAVKKGIGWVLAIGGGLSTLGGVINDILVPNGWLLSLVVMLASVAVVIVTLLRGQPAAAVPGFARRYVTGPWRTPVRTAFSLSAALSLASVGIIATAPPGGVIGAAVPGVHDWQVQLGIVAANTARIAEDVAAIKDELKDIKQETSDDPRKELANLGVPWTTEAFVDALKLSDARTVSLFLDGGMLPTAVHKGASAVAFILQPALTVPAAPMLALMVSKGFDLDAILTDDYIIVDDAFHRLPPQFESEVPKLRLYPGHFEGPALLWVVIEASYYGPTDHDRALITFLLDHGADRTVAMAYMDSSGTWNDTPAYTQVLELLKT